MMVLKDTDPENSERNAGFGMIFVTMVDVGSVEAEVTLLRRRVKALHARVHEIGLAPTGHPLVHVMRVRAGKLGLGIGNLFVGDDVGRRIRAAVRGSGAVVGCIVAEEELVLIGHDLRLPERGVVGKGARMRRTSSEERHEKPPLAYI